MGSSSSVFSRVLERSFGARGNQEPIEGRKEREMILRKGMDRGRLERHLDKMEAEGRGNTVKAGYIRRMLNGKKSNKWPKQAPQPA